MSTGDPIIHCSMCGENWYAVNGHTCRAGAFFSHPPIGYAPVVPPEWSMTKREMDKDAEIARLTQQLAEAQRLLETRTFAIKWVTDGKIEEFTVQQACDLWNEQAQQNKALSDSRKRLVALVREMKESFGDILHTLGTGDCGVNNCDGCKYETGEAIRIAKRWGKDLAVEIAQHALAAAPPVAGEGR